MSKHGFVVVFLLLIFTFGCGNGGNTVQDVGSEKQKTFAELYRGNFTDIDKIEIRNSITFKAKTIDDQVKIKDWIAKVKDYRFTLDPDQTPRTGHQFTVSLYENNQMKLRFFSNSAEKKYYILDKELISSINELYDSAE